MSKKPLLGFIVFVSVLANFITGVLILADRKAPTLSPSVGYLPPAHQTYPGFSPARKSAGRPTFHPAYQSPSELVDQLLRAVNRLRESKDLDPLNAHPILLRVAQAQADYNSSIGASTHISADGLRPFQRALAAGYPVAGDLDQGGFYSENITNGSGLSADEVVQAWLGDDLHANTMLSEYRTDFGAGVAIQDGVAYFVLDTALYSRWPVTPPPIIRDDGGGSGAPLPSHVTPNTPAADGSLQHKVRPGETLWTIAAVYGVTVEDLLRLNQLDPNRYIQPGLLLWIRKPGSYPTATPATALVAAPPGDEKRASPTPFKKTRKPISLTPSPSAAPPGATSTTETPHGRLAIRDSPLWPGSSDATSTPTLLTGAFILLALGAVGLVLYRGFRTPRG